MICIGKHNDLSGKKFGRWTVLYKADSYIRKSGRKDTQYVCKCDCGTIRVRKTKDILHSNSVSCGCYRSEQMRDRQHTE